MDDYDVFLNHRGPDVKDGFMAHLEEALRQAGLNPFLDKASLKKGDDAFRAIDKALEVARVHVAVVSRRYAESKYCLSELVAMLRSGKPVIPIFYDVEPGELRRVDKGVFAAAFEKHRRREEAERVQEWTDALCKLADITAFVFRLSDYEGNEVNLKQKVVNVVLNSLPSHDALQVESHLVGLEAHVQTCVHKLKGMSSATSFLCLVGMGGTGKTFFAKVIYNHLVSKKNFQAMSFLEIGRHTPTSLEVGSDLLSRLQKQLLWDLLHVLESNRQQSYGFWFSKLSSLGPILIVLDDIQDKGQFDKLIPNIGLLARGSCIIVTSRDRHLLKLVVGKSDSYFHEVTPLGCEDSQKLFNWHAFGDEEAPKNFICLANDVSKACGGLPLALKVVGCSLYGKLSDEDEKCIWPEAIDALKGDVDLQCALKWSYDRLSEAEKLMFVDIACVFCGWKKQEALEIWQSCKKCSSCCGSGTPHTSLRHLIEKSLVVLHNDGVDDILEMHGLLQDMGQGIGEVEESHLWEQRAMKVIEGKNQNPNKARYMNLAADGRHGVDLENFASMPNLHFLILDGCHVSGNFRSISKELRYLRWKRMPSMYIPPLNNFSNLVSLDFSESTELAITWVESEPALEGCPNLLRLNMSNCSSITTLPGSIGRLSSLEVLDLSECRKLQKLPNSIGQLTALKELCLSTCESLEALPDSITALSGLEVLDMAFCFSLLKLPATVGLMIGLTTLYVNMATVWLVGSIGQLKALPSLWLTLCTDEAVTALDTSGALANLHQLSQLYFTYSPYMAKLPETIWLLTNLNLLTLVDCKKVRELPNSIGQLEVLTQLWLTRCSSLETLPDSFGALTSLQHLRILDCASFSRLPTSIGHLSSLELLWLTGCSNLVTLPDSFGALTSLKILFIGDCASFTRLPTSIGHLSRLQGLYIHGCGALKSLPDSLRQLNALHKLQILECGSSLEGMGLRRALRGLRIWGCASISELPGSCLVVVDSEFTSPGHILDDRKVKWVWRDVKEVGVVEANDCGVLRHVREEGESGRAMLQRVHNSSCCKTVTWVCKRRRLDAHSSVFPIRISRWWSMYRVLKRRRLSAHRIS